MKNEMLCAALALLLAPACVQKMGVEGHLEPYDPPVLAGDARVSRLPPEHTVARDEPGAVSPPTRVTRELLERGRERHDIYCAPCHGFSGYGDGMVVQRGFPTPPSYHRTLLREMPDRRIFDVITHGYGAMSDYAFQVPEADRWAIVAYIRALQLSQRSRARPEEANP